MVTAGTHSSVPMHVSAEKSGVRGYPLSLQVGRRRQEPTNRPSELIAGCRLAVHPAVPCRDGTPMVEGVQSSRIPPQCLEKDFRSFGLHAGQCLTHWKERPYRPSALRAPSCLPRPTCMPSALTDTRDVDGEQAPRRQHRYRGQKRLTEIRSSTIRLSAAEASDEPPRAADLGKIAGELPWTPVLSTTGAS